jgi:hypothetical protein
MPKSVPPTPRPDLPPGALAAKTKWLFEERHNFIIPMDACRSKSALPLIRSDLLGLLSIEML